MIQFAVLGYGTVGSGVVEVFFRNRESLEKKAGVPLSLIHISEPTRQAEISYAVFCLKKKKEIIK